MNVLGLTHFLDCHDSAAALVCEGTLVAAAEEERFTRKKHDGSFPFNSIEYCLREAGLSMGQVDAIAWPVKPFRSGRDSIVAETHPECLLELVRRGELRYRTLLHKRALEWLMRTGIPVPNLGLDGTIRAGIELLRQRYGPLPRIRFYGHHFSHAAAAYYSSGQGRAAIVTADGRGASQSTATCQGRGACIRPMSAASYLNSLGFFYSSCTRYLGLGEFGHGKLMGLASYGDKDALADRVRTLLDPGAQPWYRCAAFPSEARLGFPPRRGESILNAPYPDFAAAAQDALEQALLRVVRSAIREAGADSVCLGGGVTLNCSFNGKLLSSGLASSVWLFPAAGDAGLSVGAALACSIEAGMRRPNRVPHAYWGPEFRVSECELVLRSDPRIEYRRSRDLAGEVAEALAAGEVVGWFQGRMELGPRALGNRSILADPRRVDMRDRVNSLKGRELWRPLAPAVPAGDASSFFLMEGASPFMLFAVQVRPEKRALIPAVVHVDGTARPQTVDPSQNPLLCALLAAFCRRTGVPILLNTSFNAAGEPIVCTPRNAVDSFVDMDLDLLALGPWIVRRRRSGA